MGLRSEIVSLSAALLTDPIISICSLKEQARTGAVCRGESKCHHSEGGAAMQVSKQAIKAGRSAVALGRLDRVRRAKAVRARGFVDTVLQISEQLAKDTGDIPDIISPWVQESQGLRTRFFSQKKGIIYIILPSMLKFLVSKNPKKGVAYVNGY